MRAKILRGASLSTMMLCVFFASTEASAQVANQQIDQIEPAAQAIEQDRGDRVVITGTNIRATAESAALPVEVLTAEDIFAEGGQTALDFVKTLSISGATSGESNQYGGSEGGPGYSNVNLRGLGGGRTLTIFNGRRGTENTNFLPQNALDRTEILKDGGAVIYGADATGGVVNFITKDDFEGLQIDAEYKAIKGSDGDYDLGVLWGRNFAQANIMASLEYVRRSELDVRERDWAIRPYGENPTPYTPYHDYAAFQLNVPTSVIPSGNGGRVVDFTEADCLNSNGIFPGHYAPVGGIPACWWDWVAPTMNLVEGQEQFRGYLQLNADLSDTLRFSSWLSYGKSQIDSYGLISALPANIGPAPTSGGAFQFRVPRSNPYFDTFMAQNAGQIDPAIAPFITSADQYLAIVFGAGGAPHQRPGKGPEGIVQLDNWNANAQLDGEFDGLAGDWLDTWSLSANYNLSGSQSSNFQDLIGFRIQEALNGFGGPNCNAEDLVPDAFTVGALDANGDGAVSKDEFYAVVGTQNPAAAGQNGCLYFNPFSHRFPGHVTFDQPNNRYIPGNEVPPELSRWFYADGSGGSHTSTLVMDALVTGATPLTLPGGSVGWAFGGQWLQQELNEFEEREYNDSEKYPCAWPGQEVGQVGCPAVQGAYIFSTPGTIDRVDTQQYSYFGEVQVPVLDNLSFQLAARREEFPKSGLGATVWKVAGKWDPFDWLAVRGSFGTNYSTPPVNFIPGETTSGVALVAAAGNRYLRGITLTLPEVRPETAEVGNFGVIANFDEGLPGDGALRLSADYFNFQIIDEIKTVSHNQILGSTFLAGQVPGANGLINCAAPLIERIEFVAGVGAAGCAQGITTGNDVLAVTSVRGNGPGLQTSGIDYDIQYAFSALGGEINLGLTATQILEAQIAAFTLEGVQLSQDVDALGFTNYSRDGELASEWRGNLYANYNIDNHNVRYVYRYTSGVTDDRLQFARNGVLFEIEPWITHNLYYQYTMPWDEDFTLSFSVENVLDTDPPFTQLQLSYDPLFANPLGRTFEIGLRKLF